MSYNFAGPSFSCPAFSVNPPTQPLAPLPIDALIQTLPPYRPKKIKSLTYLFFYHDAASDLQACSITRFTYRIPGCKLWKTEIKVITQADAMEGQNGIFRFRQ